MPDPFKAELSPLRDLKRVRPADLPDRSINETGAAMARQGYAVLERADPGNPFNRNLRGIAPPVTNDVPNVAWDEEK